MRRRTFLAGLVGAGAAGGGVWAMNNDVWIPGISPQAKAVGSTTTVSGIAVTVDRAMLPASVDLERPDGSLRAIDPGQGRAVALAHIIARNDTQRRAPAPAYNTRNHDTMRSDEDTIQVGGVNDIQVCGDNTCGNIPNSTTPLAYETIIVNGTALSPYGPTVTGNRPQLAPGNERSGWVLGIVDADASPEVKIRFKGDSARWSLDDTEPTPTPSSGVSL